MDVMDVSAGAPVQTLPFRFTGTARQYFGIWIVNLLLTILTLGVYAAWAKVRTKRYFYGNTVLDGTTFDYLAKPITILKGWAVAITVLIVYNIVTGLYPITAIPLSIAFLIALPWIVVRSMSFRARNSSYRNIRFTFDNAYREAIRVFVGLGLLISITLGMAMPYYIYAMNRFFVNNSGFGTRGFQMDATAKAFYKIYFVAGLLFIGFVALAGTVMIPVAQDMVAELQAAAADDSTQNDAECETSLDNGVAAPSETPSAAEPETTRAPDSNVESTDDSAIDPVLAQQMMNIQLGLGGLFVLVYFVSTAYLQARIGNLVFNTTALAGHRFESTLRARDLMWLYFSNMLGIVLSFGLLIPWARVRTARYRAEHLALLADGGLDGFGQARRTKVSATGEELGEAFDIDVGL